LIIIRSAAIKYLFRVNNAPFVRYQKRMDGSFFYRRRRWFDAILLKRRIPPPIMKYLIENYSISFSEVGIPLPRINVDRRIKLAMLMLTVEEASILTRIPQEVFKRAILLGDIKTVSLGTYTFISRQELEQLMGIIINEEKLRELVILTLTKTRKRFIESC